MLLLLFLRCARADPILPPGYSIDEPNFDHENIAIKLDAAGRS